MRFIEALAIKQFEKSFRKLKIHDREWVEKLCTLDGGIGGHIHFTTMFLCQEMYNDSFRKFNGCIIKKPSASDGKLYCQYPIGLPEERKKAVEEIVKIYSKVYREIVFFAASEENVTELQDMYGEKVTNVENSRENQNYMLDVDEQIHLEGSLFSSRRNKIRRFEKLNNWSYEEITKVNMGECLEINAHWYEGHEKTEEAVGEQRALKCALAHYDQFNFQGGILRIDGKAVAFHIGSPFNQEIYMCLFMKSLKGYRDVPIAILHEFMKRNCNGYCYINYSEDLGLEGLRLFKMNLRPKFLTPFYFITLSF